MGKKTRKHRAQRAKVSRTDTESARSSLADALFTATRQRVLGLLFGQPGRSFFASEIINLAGRGSGAVQRELARLEQSGLVTTTRLGNQKHYQANPASPVFHELNRIVSRTFGIADPIRAALEPLSGSIAWAIIYGSVAKGADTASSDIDLLIVGERLRLEDLFKLLDPAETSLHRKINPTLYNKAEFQRRIGTNEGFLSRVLDGEYIPLLGSKDAAQATRKSGSNRQAQA